MEDIFARKHEIQEKLATEKKRSEMIKASLSQANTLTNNMVSILNEFDERLHKLEDTILPLHRKTKDLQRLQDNIEKTVSALEHVIGYHHVAHEVESTLRQGPGGHVKLYLDCMERLAEAIEFFSENNPDSPELNIVFNLFKNGKVKLEKEFHSQLSRQSKPLSPTKVLEIIDKEGVAINYFSDKTVHDLAQIALWLSGPGKSQSFAKSYSEIRSRALLVTLQGLRDHVKSFTTGTSMRKAGGMMTNTPKKAGARRGSTFTRRANTLLRKESAQSITSMGGKVAYPAIAEEEVVDLDTESFVKMVSGCSKLLMAENLVLQSIIPDKQKRKVFDAMVADPLALLEQAGNKFVFFARQCISNHDHSAVVGIFPAIKHLKQTSSDYGDILKSCFDLNRTKLPTLIVEMESIGVKVLDDFTDCVKSDPEKESNMPKDGTVHELTSNTMLFMQQLSQNADIAGSMLAAQQMESQSTSRIMRKYLAKYINHVLAALKLNLENKSRVYVDGALAAIFLLNNYHFILSALDRHGLLTLVETATPEVEKIYRQIIEEQKSIYLNSWGKFHGHLSDESRGVAIDAQPGVKLKDKEKQIVKDKFKSFNTDLEELVKAQQHWAVPNAEVKKELKDMVKEKILSEYTTFRDKYRMVQFTKNIEKYLKYSPEDVEKNIERLFGQGSSL